MIKYTLIAILCYLPLCNGLIAQGDLINIRSVNISGNESIKKKELMPLLRQRPSNFSFTFKGTSFNNRLLKMDALTLKNFFISKGFLLVEVKESAEIDNNIAAIYHRQGLLALEMASQDYDSAMEISEEYEYIELAKGLFDKAAEYWYQALKLAPDNYPRARNWLRITGRAKSLDSF